jgi:methylmalonyl-CoA/ethylmalonyl-CoA epimerase
VSEVLAIDHLGIAVRDLGAAIAAFRSLGLTGGEIEELPERGLRLAWFQVGESRIELLETTDADSPVGRFLQTRGEGIHHLALRVVDAAAGLQAAADRGLALVDRQPRAGAGGTRIGFLRPSSLHGVLVELVERAGDDH